MIERVKNRLRTLLRKSEKYTKTDMVYLAKGGFWLGFGRMITSGASFILAIVFANFLPKYTYGTYKYILSIIGSLSATTLRGMDGAIIQAVARNYEGSFIPAIKLKIRYGLIGSAICVGFGAYYYLRNDMTLAGSFILASIFLPFLTSLGLYSSLLSGKKLFSISIRYEMISQIMALILMTATILVTKNIIAILFTYLVSWTLLRFIFLKITLRHYPPNENIDSDTLSYGKHSSAINITATIISSLEGILIFHFLGAVELAIYTFALAPVAHLSIIFQNIPTLAMPKLAERTIPEIQVLFKKRIIILFLTGILVALFYIAIAPFIFKIFFPQYMESIFYSQLFSLSLILTLPQIITGSVLSAKLNLTPKKHLYLWNIPSIVLAISLFLLIRPLGITGVMMSKILSSGSGLLVTYIIWKKIRASHECATII